MAMRWFCLLLLIFIVPTGCSNSSDFKTAEITALNMLRETILARSTSTVLLDTREVVTREKIDAANIPVLFVELANGQNGTLTLYPGEGVGETWLGADGATVTLKNGVLQATRGMRRDLMGTKSSMPSWSEIKESARYTRQLTYLNGKNQTYSLQFNCQIQMDGKRLIINVFGLPYSTLKYNEICRNEVEKIENTYFVDTKGIVRQSLQYHGQALETLLIMRLDR